MTMSHSRSTFFAPLGWDTFEKDYLGQRFYHFQGGREHPALSFSWEALNGLLDQEGLWTHTTLKLAHKGALIEPVHYCRQGLDREGRHVLIPDFSQVMAWWRQGAGLVCNDMATLLPSFRALASFLATLFEAQVLANIYATSQESPAFAPHFDTHDVWAFQVSGAKTWRLYGQADAPVNHALFNDLDVGYHQAHKGALSASITTHPGEILYIPRGLYHDAYAKDGPSLHVTFSVTRPTGLDVILSLFEKLLHDPFIRQDVPLGAQARRAFMEDVGRCVAQSLTQADVVLGARGAQDPVGVCALPLPVDPSFRVVCDGLRLCQDGQNVLLVTPQAQVPVPREWQGIMPWIMDRKFFSQSEFIQAHPGVEKAAFERLMKDLRQMGVLEQGPVKR